MSHNLPKFIAIGISKHYASVLTEPKGYVGAKEENIITRANMIEVETEKTDGKYVHLRFCQANRYLARVGGGTDDVWLVACSDKPEKDKSKWSCTLFEPKTSDRENELSLVHVQTEKYVRFGLGRFCLGESSFQLRYEDCGLPRYVAFEGDNGKYLSCCSIGGHEFLKFSSDVRKEKARAFEVTMNPRGYLYIKSMYCDKYLRLNDKLSGGSKWICADSTKMDNDRCTRFEAVRFEDKSIALRHSHNDKLCKRHTEGEYTDCFAAVATNPEMETRLQVYDTNIKPDEGSAKIKSQKKATLPVKARSPKILRKNSAEASACVGVEKRNRKDH